MKPVAMLVGERVSGSEASKASKGGGVKFRLCNTGHRVGHAAPHSLDIAIGHSHVLVLLVKTSMLTT
ncbi:hypothetical protein J6590_069899 [Homalodisca vitripennis]|nr:hypothetical protein J6590_069899 [Homalodisca vitripennis]